MFFTDYVTKEQDEEITKILGERYFKFLSDPDNAAKIRKYEKYAKLSTRFGAIIPRYIPEEPKWMSYYVSSIVGNFDYAPTACAFKNGKYPLESNMIVSKKIFDQVGGFNVQLPGVVGTVRIGGEGKELFYKILSLGHTIYYDPSIIVEHVVEVKKLTKEYMYRMSYRDWETDRKSTRLNSSHRL